MNWTRIESIIAKCRKQPTAASVHQKLELSDYDEVLNRYDGIEGFIAESAYVILWSFRQIVELNRAYKVREHATGITLIGTDGGDTGYGIDKISNRYVAVPLVGMSRDAATDVGGAFEEFLETIAGH